MLNAYGSVIYRRPEWRPLSEPVEFGKAGMADAQIVPFPGDKNQVPQYALKGRISERGQRAWGR